MAARSTGALSPQLFFDGSKDKFDLWETRFLGHLHILNLKETILNEQRAADRTKNLDCYAELIRLIDDMSLSLIRHNATFDSRTALTILREPYSGKSKLRIINLLYTSLTKLRKTDGESTTDYIIRAKNLITALHDAGKTLSEGLIVAMILGGLPDSYKPLAVHIKRKQN